MIDAVPKAIMSFMVNKIKVDLQMQLVRNLYTDEKLEYLMQESGDLPARRKKCNEFLRNLHEADHILNEVKEFKV